MLCLQRVFITTADLLHELYGVRKLKEILSIPALINKLFFCNSFYNNARQYK